MMSSSCLARTVPVIVFPGLLRLAAGVRRIARPSRLALLVMVLCLLAACGTTRKVGPGYYRVQSGDTLSRIALEHGQTVHSLMRMNDIDNPNVLRVGQVLKVGPGGSASTAPASGAIDMIWPAQGTLDNQAKRPGSRGIFIANQAGTPIKAAADGKVVYAGNALRGYGNMVIVEHASDVLTVYAHNASLAVKEGQRVTQGQQIATMGSSGSSKTGLYFEVRRHGKPVDTLRYLPSR
jgi:murein DD-endopeptidase MepM/ murein hydrolase activator NlpD